MRTVAVAIFRPVSDRNYIILCRTYAAVEIPCVLIKLLNICIPLDQRYSRTQIAHVKLSPGEGTQREGNGSALTSSHSVFI